MKCFSGLFSALLITVCTSMPARAAVLSESHAVAATSALKALLPAAEQFSISSAGTYTLTLSDQGEIAQSGAASFSSLYVVLTRGAQKIASLAVPSNASTVTASVTLTAGTYQAQVMGITSGASSYVVELKNAANTVVWSDAGNINATPEPDYGTLVQQVTLTAGHSYTLSLVDHAFPATLDSLIANIVESSLGGCSINAAPRSCSFTATSGTATLAVIADPNANGKGLYGIRLVDNTSSTVVLAASYPVGALTAVQDVTLPAAGAYTFTTTDLGVPEPLTAFKSVLVQGGISLISQSAAGTGSFTGATGAAKLYVQATAGTGGLGLYGVSVRRGSTQVFDTVQSVENTASSTAPAYVFDASITASGTYVVALTDFQVPQSLTSVSLAVSQNGVLLGQRTSSGSLQLSNVVPGTLSVAVLPTAGTSGSGLIGVSVTPIGGTAVLEKTQGIGGAFISVPVSISQAARYGLRAADLVAPLSFDNLIVSLTRGAQQIGSVYATSGTGEFMFDATPGVYALSIIAKAKSSVGFGSYGIEVAGTPVVTLQTSSSSVSAGSPVTLTWNASDAESCTASGGWTGNKSAAGSQTIATVASRTTFSLSCVGVGGAGTNSVTVDITAENVTSKGGGGLKFGWLAALAGLLLIRRSGLHAIH